MTRMVRPSDIKDATEWYTGCVLASRAGKSRRVVQARLIHWAALRALGLSYPEIGRQVGRDHSTIIKQLRLHPPAKCWVDDVMERANAQVRAESAVQLSMEER